MSIKTVFVLIALLLAAFIVGVIMANGYGELQATIVVLTGIGIITFFLYPLLTRQETDQLLSKILAWGIVARIVSVFLRFWIYYSIGITTADAIGYVRNGSQIAQLLWRMEFAQLIPMFSWGTSFINFFTGFIFSLTGVSENGGFLVYGVLAYWGSYLFYRAFATAFPQGNKRLFAILIFFFPSILFWANGIGKDSLIFLFIGITSYGGALFLTRSRFRGLIVLALGLIGVFYIRPHIAVILGLPLVLGYVLHGVRNKAYRQFSFIIVLALFTVASILLIPLIADLIGIPGLSIAQVFTYLQQRQELSAIGESTFQAVDISNPIMLPYLVITVLFRPFPWEAHNLQAIIQSLEGVLLFAIIIWRIRSIKSSLTSVFSNPYILFSVCYIVVFILVFSLVQNFGILARERTMMFPFLFMLLAFQPVLAETRTKTADIQTTALIRNSG